MRTWWRCITATWWETSSGLSWSSWRGELLLTLWHTQGKSEKLFICQLRMAFMASGCMLCSNISLWFKLELFWWQNLLLWLLPSPLLCIFTPPKLFCSIRGQCYQCVLDRDIPPCPVSTLYIFTIVCSLLIWYDRIFQLFRLILALWCLSQC